MSDDHGLEESSQQLVGMVTTDRNHHIKRWMCDFLEVLFYEDVILVCVYMEYWCFWHVLTCYSVSFAQCGATSMVLVYVCLSTRALCLFIFTGCLKRTIHLNSVLVCCTGLCILRMAIKDIWYACLVESFANWVLYMYLLELHSLLKKLMKYKKKNWNIIDHSRKYIDNVEQCFTENSLTKIN